MASPKKGNIHPSVNVIIQSLLLHQCNHPGNACHWRWRSAKSEWGKKFQLVVRDFGAREGITSGRQSCLAMPEENWVREGEKSLKLLKQPNSAVNMKRKGQELRREVLWSLHSEVGLGSHSGFGSAVWNLTRPRSIAGPWSCPGI